MTVKNKAFKQFFFEAMIHSLFEYQIELLENKISDTQY